ncbi:hypothetical protein Avbf_00436, partial [Armadillidium vulgare]
TRCRIHNFEVPEINFDEWLLREPTCGSELSSVNWQKAADDILNFTVVFRNLYSIRFATLNFEQLRKYSYTINKSADFLNKFPKFVKKILPNLSTKDDVIFMENALDIFSVLEQWRHFLLEQMYSHIENLSKNTQGIYVSDGSQSGQHNNTVKVHEGVIAWTRPPYGRLERFLANRNY